MGKKDSLGIMYAIMGVDIEEVEKYISETNGKTVIANINSKNQIVISGFNNETSEIANKLSLHGGSKVLQLNVSGAFHSPLMEEAKKNMDFEIENTMFHKPECYTIPNITAIATNDIEVIKDSLKRQITSRVNWLETILYIKNMGIENLYEVGPGEVLKKINKSITLKPKCYSLL